MGVFSKLFQPDPPCVPTVCQGDGPPDSSLREEVTSATGLSPYGLALKKQDEASGLFIDEDCYLLSGDPGFKTRTIYRKYWMSASAVAIGCGTILLGRALSRLPWYSKGVIWKIPLVGVSSWMVGGWLQDYMDAYTAERDAQFLHYCRLHAQDFPRKEKVLYRDYLAPWYPVR